MVKIRSLRLLGCCLLSFFKAQIKKRMRRDVIEFVNNADDMLYVFESVGDAC